MDEPTLRYSNGDNVVLWRPKRCIHSGICVRGLGTVFDVTRRHWIDILAATSDEIVAQVEKCPSGALTWENEPESRIEA